MYKSWMMILTVCLLAIFLWMQQGPLLDWLENYGEQYLFLTIVTATLLSLFPVIPYPIVGGVIGAAFGPEGALIVWTGSTAASIIFFLMIRYSGFKRKGQKMLLTYKPVRNITMMFEKNAFLSIVMLRMIPVMPSIIINAYAGLSSVKFVTYTAASALGKLPSMLLFAVVGYSAVTDFHMVFFSLAVYSVFIAAVYLCYKYWIRRIKQAPLPAAIPQIDKITDESS